MWVAFAFLVVFGQTRLVLLPVAGQLAAPDAVALYLCGDFVQALLDGFEVARHFFKPLRRGFADKTGIHQMAQLLLDVVQRHGLGQVDFAFEAFLQAVPKLENIQRQLGQAFGLGGPVTAFAFGQRG